MERMRDDTNALYIAPPAFWKERDMDKVDSLSVKEEKMQMVDNCNWRRQRMSSETIHELEMEFARHPKPSRSEIENMAARFGQRENNIYAWFYRRRNREVREADVKSTDYAEEEVVPVKRAPPSSPPSTSRKERKNSRNCRFFNKEEQTVLENVFARQNYPGDSEIEGLARWFQKDERKVSAWFARRRLKFTKDFVKNIDLDSFVSPVPNCDGTPDGSLETEAKYFNGDGVYQRPFPSRYISRTKDLKSQFGEDGEDEECDVERLSPPPPEKEHWKLSCLTCTPQTPTLPISPKIQPDEVKQTSRKTVIQWYPKPTKIEHSSHSKLNPPQSSEVNIPRREVTYSYAASRCSKNHFEKTEPPGLLPIEWLFQFPQFFSLGSSLDRLPYCDAESQWHVNPRMMYSPNEHSGVHINRDYFRFNDIETVLKKE